MVKPSKDMIHSEEVVAASADKMPEESMICSDQPSNPILQMIEDKKRIFKAIKNGKSLSTLTGIKIVSPL